MIYDELMKARKSHSSGFEALDADFLEKTYNNLSGLWSALIPGHDDDCTSRRKLLHNIRKRIKKTASV
jgi:hypothetical protein